MLRSVRVLAIGLLTVISGSGIAAQGATSRPTLAVMNFTNAALTNKADYDPLEWGIPELIATRLASNTQIDVVERSRLSALIAEQDLSASGRVDQSTAVRIGKLVGARYVVLGTVVIDKSNHLIIAARVVDVETSRLVHAERFDRAKWDEDMSYAIDSIAERLNRNLKLPGRPQLNRSGGANRPTEPANKSVAGSVVASQSGTARGATAAAAPAATANKGVLTLGRAMRLAASGPQHKQEAVGMLRTAALETPSLAADVAVIARRMGGGER